MGALVRLEEVPARCDSDAAPAVDGASLQIAPGEAGAVMGPSGLGTALAVLMLARFAVCDRWLYRSAGRERTPARVAADPQGKLSTDLSQGGQQS